MQLQWIHLSKDTLVVSLGSFTSRKMFTCRKKSVLWQYRNSSFAREIFVFTFKIYVSKAPDRDWKSLRALSWLGNWTEKADLTVHWDHVRRTPLPRDVRNHEISSGNKSRIFVEKLLWSHGARKIAGSIVLKLVLKIEVHESQVFHRLSTDVESSLVFNWQQDN